MGAHMWVVLAVGGGGFPAGCQENAEAAIMVWPWGLEEVVIFCVVVVC